MSELSELEPVQASYTKPLTYIRGAYMLGSAALPYFNVTLSVPDAVTDLKLQRDVILDPRKPVHFQELFQRDVDMDRVRDQIVPYLAKPQHIKFFNAITVVLLPVDPTEGTVLDRFPDSSPQGAPDVGKGMERIDVGPVQLQNLKSDKNIGRICWDRDSIKPVIVDGQHRFAALKYAWDSPDKEFPYRAELRHTSIAVLLLVLDPRAGFSPGEHEPVSVLQASRSIFMDLNKHAVEVSRSRQVLLDDRDLIAVCMRALIDQEVVGEESQESVDERIARTGQVPIAVLDWQGNTAKFDTTMYLSTVLTAYELTEIALGPVDISPTDREKAAEAIESLIQRLNIDDSAEGFRLKAELKDATEREIPFALTRPQIANVGKAFSASRGSLVTSLLTQLTPYRELLSAYGEDGFINGIYEQWAALDSRGRKAFMDALGDIDPEDHPNKLVRKCWEPVKKSYPLAFQVVFQKAAIAAVCDCYDMREAYGNLIQAPSVSDLSPNDFAVKWVDRFNQRLTSQLAINYREADSLWDGSVITLNRTITFSDPGRKALTGAIVFALMAPLDDWNSASDAESWLKKAWAEIRRGHKSTETQRLLSRFGRTGGGSSCHMNGHDSELRTRTPPIDRSWRDLQSRLPVSGCSRSNNNLLRPHANGIGVRRHQHDGSAGTASTDRFNV